MAVLGGGPAGAATALALVRHDPSLAVALVEGGTYATPRVGETLPPAVRPRLEGLGVWRSFVDQRHLASRGTSAVWGPASPDSPPADHDFLLSPQAEGWHLDRARFDRWLAGEAAAAGCELLLATTYLGHERAGAGGWRLNLRHDGEPLPLAARRVVDATGRRAAFARHAGAAPVVFDDLLAVFRFLDLAAPDAVASTHALVEAVEAGWWYASRLPGERLAVGLFADADAVAEAGLRDADGWQTALAGSHHVRRWAAAAEASDAPPTAHPADSRHLAPLTGDGWLAVGDAASCYDPLSSQGILKALRFGRLAAYAVADSLANEEAMAAAFERYAAWVRGDFEGYLAARAEVYRRERRWSGAPFWRRRHEELTLDPQRLLAATDAPIPRPARHLPAADLARLRALCDPPRPAHEIVRRFRETTPAAPPDRRLILTLQYLVEIGVTR